MTASQRVDPSDEALAAFVSPTASSVVDDLNGLRTHLGVWVQNWVGVGVVIALAPVLVPTLWIARNVFQADAPDYFQALSYALTKALTNPFKANAGTATDTGNSSVVNHKMSSAATDSTDTSAPKASRRVHRAAPEQGSASKRRSAQPNTAAGRTAAKHADAPKAGTHRAERRAGRGTRCVN
jgi:hypothetical protein